MADNAAPKNSWWKGLKAEWRKISWPDKTTLTKQTVAVVITSIITGVIITIVDALATSGIHLLVK